MFVGLILIIIVVILCLVINTRRPKNFPPGPPSFPFFGNTPLLKKLSKIYGGQHLALSKLAKDYNTNVLSLKLGSDNVIVVFGLDLVREVLTNEVFEGRPDNFFLKLRCMGRRRGVTCTDGEEWSTIRNFLVRHLRNVGFGRSPMEFMIQEELQDMLNTIEKKKESVQFGRLIAPSVLSVLWGLTAGSRVSRDDPQLTELLDLFNRRSKAFDLSGGALSHFPFLRFIAPEKSGYNLIMKINSELLSFFMKTINYHYDTWQEGRDDDVIYAFISAIKKGNKLEVFNNDQLLMVCLDLFLAGTETTSNTIDFALLLMVLYPDVQKKVQEYIDAELPKGVDISFCYRYKLPYVEAVLLESQRLLQVVPICGPRRVLKNTVLDGYSVPKNTTVLIHLHSVHRDPNIWTDPEEFKPERFLKEGGKLTSSEKVLPFGLGKRRCLGETLAKCCIFSFFVGILRDYTITTLPGSPKPTLTPLPGITLSPQKYKVFLKKRQ